MRLREQVGVIVELRHLEQDVRGRHVNDVLDAEQQVEFLTDAYVEVLHDLRGRQRELVDRHHAQRTLPQAVTAGLVAEHEGEGVVPVDQRARLRRIPLRDELAVNVDLASRPVAVIDRAVGCDNVLQGRLQDLVGIRRGQLRLVAVGARRRTAMQEVVVIKRLVQREVARRVAGRVSHDT